MVNAIYYRRSCRSYSSEPLTQAELAEIKDFSKIFLFPHLYPLGIGEIQPL